VKSILHILALLFLLIPVVDVEGQTCAANYSFMDDGLTIEFSDQSTSAAGDPIISWEWDFDDGSTSTAQNPTHTFAEPDKYDVCLIITTTDACSDEFCFKIEICTLEMTANVLAGCNESNEIQVDLVISDPFDAAVGINILVDGVAIPGSPFDIDDVAPVNISVFVPGDGLEHTIVAQSVNVGHCNAEFVFTSEDCTSDCFLSALSVAYAGAVTHNVDIGDNFFSPSSITIQAGDIVRWDWIGDGHSTTSDATSGNDSWNSGVLSLGSSYQTTIDNPGVHQYYCIPHGAPGGVGMSAIIIANCPPDNNFDLEVSFITSVANPAGFDLLIDNIQAAGSPFDYTGVGVNMVVIPITGDGLPHTIDVVDVNDPTCSLSSNINSPDCGAAPTCSLGLQLSQSSGCNAQNEVTVECVITDINGGASGFVITVDGIQVAGPVTYDASGISATAVQVLGDGQSHIVVAQDIDNVDCFAEANITTENCTIPCSLSNLGLTTGSPVTHTVEVRDFEFLPKHSTIATGDNVEFVWLGEIEHTSTSDATSGPDSWDSGLFGLGATFQIQVLTDGIHPFYCIPHGAPGGVGMSGTITVQPNCTDGQVPVLVTFDEVAGGFSGFDVLVDGIAVPGGPFPYDQTGQNSITVQVPGDGATHTVKVVDFDDQSCNVAAFIATSDCNISTCQLTVQTILAGNCSDQGDVPVNIEVTDIGGGDMGFQVLIDGLVTAGSPYNYDSSGVTMIQELIIGDGMDHSILIVDLNDAVCVAATSVSLPDCSVSCQLIDLSASTGSNSSFVVEVRDFSFFPQNLEVAVGDTVIFTWVGDVEHTSTSDATDGPGSWNSGLSGQGATFEVVFFDAGVHPYYCIPHGGSGGVGMSGTITAVADCDSGFVSVNLSFLDFGGSIIGYQILVDGDTTTGSPYAYDTAGTNQQSVFVAGDGQSHTIVVEDIADPNCSASVDVLTPDCNAIACNVQLQATAVGGCTAEGLIPVDLNITGSGLGETGFSLFTDGIIDAGSPFMYDSSGTTVIQVFLPGDEATHQFFIFDLDDVTCSDIDSIATPNCGNECKLSNISVDFGVNTTHIVEVRDFSFFPDSINIQLGDTVHFDWVGVVAHTSTSDATTGPDAWNSELMGQGGAFDLLITTPGIHPYYCIPHGAAGGIGMSGVVVVQEACDAGTLPATICFDAVNGSFEGYRILVDGTPVAGPLAYSGGVSSCAGIEVDGDGLAHEITIQDVADTICTADTIIIFPDCEDPCFGFDIDFVSQVNVLTNDVTFEAIGDDASSYLWMFGDGEVSSLVNPVHAYDSSGIYTACLIAIASDGCTDTVCHELIVGEFVCDPLFTIENDGLLITLLDVSVTSLPINNWIWTFGDGGVSTGNPSATYQYDTLGIYEVCVTIQADSCNATYCSTIDLSDQCLLTDATFDYTISGGTVQFSPNSVQNATSFLWGFGDGTTSENESPMHTYSGSGLFTVCLLVLDEINNCTDFSCQEIQITTTGTRLLRQTEDLILFPNPVSLHHEAFYLSGIADFDKGRDAVITLYSLSGQEILSNHIVIEDQIMIDPGRIGNAGMYVVQLTTGSKRYLGKLVIY
jgi:plastocyanin